MLTISFSYSISWLWSDVIVFLVWHLFRILFPVAVSWHQGFSHIQIRKASLNQAIALFVSLGAVLNLNRLTKRNMRIPVSGNRRGRSVPYTYKTFSTAIDKLGNRYAHTLPWRSETMHDTHELRKCDSPTIFVTGRFPFDAIAATGLAHRASGGAKAQQPLPTSCLNIRSCSKEHQTYLVRYETKRLSHA